MNRPEIWIPIQANALFGLMRDLNKTRRTTFVIVTHNDKLSAQSDRIIHMQDGMIV